MGSVPMWESPLNGRERFRTSDLLGVSEAFYH